MHLFWLTLFVPAVILGQWIWPILKRRSIWSLSAIVVGLLTIGWLVLGLPTLGVNEQNFAGVAKMFAFRVLASSDLPVFQLLIACSVGWLRSGWSNQTPASIPTSGLESGSPSNDLSA